MNTFSNVFQPTHEEVIRKESPLKGNWKNRVFGNQNPITLELGCGKGDYSISLAKRYPERNFIGVDIKGARIWTGAKEAQEAKMGNVVFLRTRIEFISSFFAPREIGEVWITFPDPQLKRRRNKKRLTSVRFINAYFNFIEPGGFVHLKTDNLDLYSYTLEMLAFNKIDPPVAVTDIYNCDQKLPGEVRGIQTFYEKQFLKEGNPIHYLMFSIPHEVKEPPIDEK